MTPAERKELQRREKFEEGQLRAMRATRKKTALQIIRATGASLAHADAVLAKPEAKHLPALIANPLNQTVDRLKSFQDNANDVIASDGDLALDTLEMKTITNLASKCKGTVPLIL